MTLVRRTLRFFHRDKENEPSSLNDTAPPCRRRSTTVTPYATRKKVPTPFALNEATFTNSRQSATVKPTSLATMEEEETSPTIRRILEKTGCSSRQELLAKRAAEEANTNGLKVAPNGWKAATATNGAKSSATNRSKSTTNVAKVSKSSNGSKATNGSTTTNPKKKARSKYFLLDTLTQKYCHSLILLLFSFEWIQVYIYKSFQD